MHEPEDSVSHTRGGSSGCPRQRVRNRQARTARVEGLRPTPASDTEALLGHTERILSLAQQRVDRERPLWPIFGVQVFELREREREERRGEEKSEREKRKEGEDSEREETSE